MAVGKALVSQSLLMRYLNKLNVQVILRLELLE